MNIPCNKDALGSERASERAPACVFVHTRTPNDDDAVVAAAPRVLVKVATRRKESPRRLRMTRPANCICTMRQREKRRGTETLLRTAVIGDVARKCRNKFSDVVSTPVPRLRIVLNSLISDSNVDAKSYDNSAFARDFRDIYCLT